MASEKTYHALIPDKIFMGAATDVESMVKNEGIDVIVDLRGEATECAYPAANAKWIQIPLGDHAVVPQEKAFEQAIRPSPKLITETRKWLFIVAEEKDGPVR
ncbi:hypothetical protein PV433_18535 [Paenibacillus sp. GYB004]|uniref:hypothetical protein n=1 Tax=Paenibacillus sp. GYB004 TaxID=2994393 RepID=UPI002F96E6BC